jgi:hypothetical protein
MSLVSAESIKEPKIEVTLPIWLKVVVGLILALLFVGVASAPIASNPIKLTILGLYSVILLGLANKTLKGNYLVTLKANNDGLYFQTSEANTYFHVPWSSIGVIEKAIFPLNSRGIRVEVTSDYKAIVKNTEYIGNVIEIENRLFIYTIPQLNDRDKLIDKLLSFKCGLNGEA